MLKEISKVLRGIEINCEEDLDLIEEKLNDYEIEKYTIDCDIAFDSPGLDVFYYAIAYVYNGQLYMLTGTFAN